MTSPFKNVFLLVSSFALFSIGSCSALRINPNVAPSPLLEQVCSQTKTPDFCIASLGSDPRSAKADLRDLGDISLVQCLSSADENSDIISAMIKDTKDPGVKLGLQHCTVNYGGSVYALELQITHLSNFKYKEAGELVGITTENTIDCERAFIQGPTHSSPLTMRNEKLEKLSEISDVIIGLLLKSVG